MAKVFGDFDVDEHGRFGWDAPEDETVHSYINELGSSFSTYPSRPEDVRDHGLLHFDDVNVCFSSWK